MNPQTKTSASDFFLNLGAIVAIYMVVINLLTLLFTVINRAYPPVSKAYGYFGSSTISWPVATLIIVFPIFVLLMWLLERSYKVEPEKRQVAIKRWLTFITLFVAGIALAIDLVTVLYHFIDGQDLTASFLLKVLSVFVVTLGVFLYYLSDIRGKLTSASRRIWLVVAVVVMVASVVWGFAVLGSPATQRLYKYDEQKSNDLSNINSEIMNSYSQKGALPEKLADMSGYYIPVVDSQTGQPYTYEKTGDLTYKLCAEFNKATLGVNEKDQVIRTVDYVSPF